MTQIPTATMASATPSAATPTNPKGELGQEGFLKLMVAQLQEQNPMEPGNSNEYVNELATFTQMEQITNLASTSELSGAVQLIGHEVSYTSPLGKLEKGTVEGVQRTTSGITVTIDGQTGIEMSKVTQVS
ncbi:MAG TPA: flagellar hook capping FlgD N-terminal domain-containing protein [Solirubrobacteraceae bacterium]|jgi:flagellar basal-body rod modification protein FlgD|nr:flagellar hook capping FlgD N-terminal domain-containing protein [Solirubrobacteraceae bacterium]